MSKYTTADKVYTDNSMLDELVHNVKLILQGIIVKDQQEAEDNETPESISNADLYIAIKENKVLFTEFVYDGAIMREMNQMIIDEDLPLDPLTDEEIAEYVVDNSLIPDEYRPLLISIASDEFMANYTELNNYYRRLNGQKDLGDADFFVDISFIPPTYYQQFIPNDVLAAYNSTGKSQSEIRSDMRDMAIAYLQSTPITDFSTYQISLMDQVGIMDKILDQYPELPYLRHLGGKKIQIYNARKAERFEILYLPECESQIRARFQDIYDTTRVMYLKRYYSAAYKFENKYYDRFFILMLISQVANDLLVEMPEYFISRTVFDNRTVQLILEANGVKYFPEIPLKYQISIVRGLTSLIKYKSTTKNMYDIAKLFFLKNVTVYKYYLMKKRNISTDDVVPSDYNGGDVYTLIDYDLNWNDPYFIGTYDICNGGWPGTGEPGASSDNQFSGVLDGGTPLKSTNFVTGADLDKMYSLFFIKVPIGDTLDNYLRDTIYRTNYDVITNEDPYWDGPNSHNYVKYEILKKNFTTQCTKYLSLGSSYSAKEYLFQVTYFLNLLLNTKADASLLNLQVPVISANAEFNIRDLVLLLYCFSFKYFEPQTDDIIDLKNRDPRPATHVDPTITYGDYDPEELQDWVMDGRFPGNEKQYYNADGGKVTQNGLRPINITGGRPINSVVQIDFPETDAIIFDEASTIMDYDGLRVLEFIEVDDINGGDPFSAVFDRDAVLDGGYVVNSYLYTGKEDKEEDDPCTPYKEPIDKFRYPYMDLSDRIIGFNMEANLAELKAIIEPINHPKFQWLRGYDLSEIVPALTQPINAYEGTDSFPAVGVVGQLYEDLTTGKFYVWNDPSYMPIKTVYSKGILDFKVPVSNDLAYADVDELLDIYATNKEIYENLIAAIKECDTQDEYYILEYVKDYLFTMKMDLSYLTLPSTGKMATRYTEFLKEKDGIIYAFFESIMSENNLATRQYNMSTYIDQIIESIQAYLSTDMLEYIFYFVPTVSWGIVLKYVSLMVNFFKSYKTHVLDVGSTMIFDNEEENAMTQFDHAAFKTLMYEKGDRVGIYDVPEFDITMDKDDIAIRDRYLDRIYIKETYGKEWVDANGGTVDQNYWSLDVDANDNTHDPGYRWPYTTYYVLDGGMARDATLDPEPDPLTEGTDYDPTWHNDWIMDGGYPTPLLIMDNADGNGPYVSPDGIIDIDGGILAEGWLAPIDSPHFTGRPTAPTPEPGDNSNRISTTEFVQTAMADLIAQCDADYDPMYSDDRALNNAMRYAENEVTFTPIEDD